MTFKQMEYFLAIADAGHITTAAKNLNISQPPLSLQLKALEDELGVDLFERDKRNLTITREGLLLQERSREIIRKVNDTVRDIQNLGAASEGTLRIGAIISASNNLLPGKMLSFTRTHPQIKFSVIEGDSDYLMELLDNGELDLAIIREPFNTGVYHSVPLSEHGTDASEADYFAAYGLPEFFEGIERDTITLSELKGKPLIINKRYYDLIINTCRQRGFSPNIVCENTEITSSVSWAKAGIGVSIASHNALKFYLADDGMVCKKIVQPSVNTKSFLIWRKDANSDSINQQFIHMFE